MAGEGDRMNDRVHARLRLALHLRALLERLFGAA